MTALPPLRHLDYGPDASIEGVGAAGIQAILDGFGLDTWRPILNAVAADPWGSVAQRVERVADHLERAGVGALMRLWLARCRGGLHAKPVRLADLRSEHGLSQRDLAERMGISQAQVARLESSDSPTTRSIRRYLEALGHRELGILASGNHHVRLVRL